MKWMQMLTRVSPWHRSHSHFAQRASFDKTFVFVVLPGEQITILHFISPVSKKHNISNINSVTLLMLSINMMPVNHVQSRVCHVTVLADAGSLPQSESNRMLTAGDLMVTGAIKSKHFLKFTYSTFKWLNQSQVNVRLPNGWNVRTVSVVFGVNQSVGPLIQNYFTT